MRPTTSAIRRYEPRPPPPSSQTLLAQPVIAFTNEDVIQNYFDAGIRHSFTPRFVGEFSIDSVLVNYENPIYADSMSTGGQGFGTYVLDGANSIGGGLGYSRQSFKRPGAASGGTDYYQLFLIWNHQFSPTWTLRANAGPTLVSPDATSFPTSATVPEFSLPVRNGNETTLFLTDPATCPSLPPTWRADAGRLRDLEFERDLPHLCGFGPVPQ